MGWDTETISIALTISFILINCVKKIFEKLCDLSENWRGADAKWFDECSNSDTAELDLWEYDIQSGETDQIMFGTVDPKSAIHCKGVFGIGESGSNPLVNDYAKAAFDSIAQYYMNNVADRLFS